uniref:Uncharacterized protein n=1 Tax=Labrus bergylta TaxID=56723 RepID=A0A3Q3EZN4_9LABR
MSSFQKYLNMDSRFAHLRQRDTSVSMLRVKLSRRRSQSQKENRDRAVNSRRQLDQVPELDVSSLDASIAMANMSIIQEKTLNKTKVAKSKESVSIASLKLKKTTFTLILLLQVTAAISVFLLKRCTIGKCSI